MSFVAIAVVLALTALEWRWPARREPTQRLVSLAVWVVRSFAAPPVLVVYSAMLVAPVQAALHLPHLETRHWPWALNLVWWLLMADFSAYVFHRLQHAVPFLWRWHRVHHSDPNMCALTTERHFWGDQFAKVVVQGWFLAMVADASPQTAAVMAIVNLWNYVAHANLPIDFGRFSWLWNSPAYHRVHHSSDPADFNTNFAGLLPIYDVIFGAYRRPNPSKPIVTGLGGPPPRPLFALWPYLAPAGPLRSPAPRQAPLGAADGA